MPREGRSASPQARRLALTPSRFEFLNRLGRPGDEGLSPFEGQLRNRRATDLPSGEDRSVDNSAADLDDLATRLWPLVVQRIDELVEMTSEVGSWSVRSNTSLSGDDRRSRPYQTSHAVQSCLATGIDNLHGLRHMMFGAPSEQPSRIVIHQAAHYLLARGALESFATGLWLLTPAARAERVTRTLRWHVQNVKDMHTALEALPDQTLSTTREEN